jgi:GAF domain-containing protein
MLLDEDGQVLVTKAAAGLSSEAAVTTQIRIGEGIAGWVAQNRAPLLLPWGPEMSATFREILAREGTVSALCVPLEEDGHLLGVLSLTRQGDAPPFTPPDLWAASLIADRLAAGLAKCRSRGQPHR